MQRQLQLLQDEHDLLKINQEKTLSKLNAHNSSEVESLKQQLNDMTAANSEISAENARLWIQVETLMTQVGEHQEKIDSLTEKQVSLVDANELARSNDEMDQLRNTMEAEILQKDAELEKGRIQLDAWEAKLTDIQAQVLFLC